MAHRLCCAQVLPVDTNIVLFEVKEGLSAAAVVESLKQHGVLACAMSHTAVRLVTHLDVDDAMVDRACQLLSAVVTDSPAYLTVLETDGAAAGAWPAGVVGHGMPGIRMA
jgi:hypothetical protein